MTRFLEQLSKRDIEARAEALLQKVYGTAVTSGPIDPESITEQFFGLRLFYGTPDDIGQPVSVLGSIFFDSKEIFINEALLGAPGRLRFTLAHELGHWVLHQDVVDPIEYAWPYVPGKKIRGRLILCRAGDTNLIESQANMFAAALLMPKWSFGQTAARFIQDMQAPRGSAGFLVSSRDHNILIKQLASHFQVSLEAARIRLKDTALVTIGDPNQARFQI